MLDLIRKHIEGKFAAASIDESPFPHTIIEGFFPQDVYDRLIEYNPFRRNEGQEWLSKSRSTDVTSRTPYHARKQINFHADQRFDAPESEQAFWNEIKSCFLADNWFPDLVRATYPTFFNLRFGDLTKDDNFAGHFTRELFLQRHEPGYYIGPHTDIPTRVFTCIFSLASAPGYDEFGTELLTPKDPMERCWGVDHYDPAGFEIKKLAPYKPNNFLLFFKTRHSFHSVRDIGDTVPDQRYGMQFQFYEPYGGLFKDLSVPALMSSKKAEAPLPQSITAKAVRKIKQVMA